MAPIADKSDAASPAFTQWSAITDRIAAARSTSMLMLRDLSTALTSVARAGGYVALCIEGTISRGLFSGKPRYIKWFCDGSNLRPAIKQCHAPNVTKQSPFGWPSGGRVEAADFRVGGFLATACGRNGMGSFRNFVRPLRHIPYRSENGFVSQNLIWLTRLDRWTTRDR